MTRFCTLLLACFAVTMAWADDATTMPAAQKADALTSAVDPYDATDQKVKFLKLAGKTSELDAKTFDADRKAGGNLIMPYEKWETAAAFDANKNGKLDWFEFVEYRQAMRKAVLTACDKNKDDKLTGDERTEAIKLLTAGKLAIKPKAVRTTTAPSGPTAAADPMPLSDWMKQFDKDGDGKLNEEEVQAMFREQYVRQVDRVAKLSEEQKQKLRERHEAYDKDLAAFESQDAQRWAEVLKVQRDALDRSDWDKLDALHKKGAEPEAIKKELIGNHRARMMAVLTEEQRVAWRTENLLYVARMAVNPAKLTEEQIEKLKATFASDLKDEAFDRYGPTHTGFNFDTRGDKFWEIRDAAQAMLTQEQKEDTEWNTTYNRVYTAYSAIWTEKMKKDVQAGCEELRKSGVTPRGRCRQAHREGSSPTDG